MAIDIAGIIITLILAIIIGIIIGGLYVLTKLFRAEKKAKKQWKEKKGIMEIKSGKKEEDEDTPIQGDEQPNPIEPVQELIDEVKK